MKLAKYRRPDGQVAVGLIDGMRITPLNTEQSQYDSLFEILEADDPVQVVEFLADTSRTTSLTRVQLLAPIDDQEVWAAGVTYKRSQTARMEESDAAADCYDRVYQAARPELFFKATPNRVSGPNEPLRIRGDSEWNVPEPEITLVLNSHLHIVGYTVGNDMSSRDIEGENPLYLPQAKVYEYCCGIGPCITLAGTMPPRDDTIIEMTIFRHEEVVFQETTGLSNMARSFDDLVGWLARDNTFPHGAFLLTGTGIVPKNDFTLEAKDVVEITITGIGTLSNVIIQDKP